MSFSSCYQYLCDLSVPVCLLICPSPTTQHPSHGNSELHMALFWLYIPTSSHLTQLSISSLPLSLLLLFLLLLFLVTFLFFPIASKGFVCVEYFKLLWWTMFLIASKLIYEYFLFLLYLSQNSFVLPCYMVWCFSTIFYWEIEDAYAVWLYSYGVQALDLTLKTFITWIPPK